jgi:endogenous inhibitor of DNA gyrase (YacG/DUF329 family)
MIKPQVKKVCRQCGKASWGLVRYYVNRHAFCSRKCADDYRAWLAEQLRVKKWREWLTSRPH